MPCSLDQGTDKLLHQTHQVPTEKTVIFIFTANRTSNLTNCISIYNIQAVQLQAQRTHRVDISNPYYTEFLRCRTVCHTAGDTVTEWLPTMLPALQWSALLSPMSKIPFCIMSCLNTITVTSLRISVPIK